MGSSSLSVRSLDGFFARHKRALGVVMACMAASHAAAMPQPLPAPSAACTAVWAAAGLQGQHKDALLVVLSPRMVYSLLEWRRMHDVAVAAGFEVVVARDPRVPRQEWLSALQVAGLPELATVPEVDADQAGRCGLMNHFPSALVGRCGHPHPWPIVSVMPSAFWRSLLLQRREAIACP